MTYYNEIEPYCVEWLRNLIAAGHLPAGEVDPTDIREVVASRITAPQAHFFAGIGGWAYALELAEWPADRPVWTGSCPCQPYSAAGKRKGDADERNLWPVWFDLIRECRPPTIFGEQVAAAIGFGWLDRVFADLEREGYACGAAVLPACGVGAPHLRQRLFWVADAECSRWATASAGPQIDAGRQSGAGCGPADGLGDADDQGPQGRRERPEQRADQRSPWAASELIHCLDGKTRRIPIEPRFQPLADGLPGRRVGILRAAGNAIVPQVAAEFIRAFLDV